MSAHKADQLSCRWDDDLTWELVTAITDDVDTKNILYPVPGLRLSTKDGGGKPKTDTQFALAKLLFAEHEVYGELFRKTSTTPKEKKKWFDKVKNKLSR